MVTNGKPTKSAASGGSPLYPADIGGWRLSIEPPFLPLTCSFVGRARFELVTPRPPVWCATKLRHRPCVVRQPRLAVHPSQRSPEPARRSRATPEGSDVLRQPLDEPVNPVDHVHRHPEDHELEVPRSALGSGE